jgi:hypothetical protein
MSKTIVNLTLPVVIEEIETVLENYPYYPYQQAFANPDLRQKLIAYILSRTSNFYTVIEEGEQLINPQHILCDLDKRSQIETTVAQGIQDILQQNTVWETHCIPVEIDSGYAPSHWFG